MRDDPARCSLFLAARSFWAALFRQSKPRPAVEEPGFAPLNVPARRLATERLDYRTRVGRRVKARARLSQRAPHSIIP
jgi:hypothetical protein